MTAATIEPEARTSTQPDDLVPEVVGSTSSSEPSQRDLVAARRGEDLRVERLLFRDTIVGAAVGAIVCAPIWVGLVFLALRNSGTALVPVVAMGVGLGLYAGLFLGGCAGALVGAKTLEHYEHENLPAVPRRQP